MTMGLYLCVFSDEEEIDGVEVGSYADFGLFRDCIEDRLEQGVRGSRFPTLMLQADSDGCWSPIEARELLAELDMIAQELRAQPPIVPQATTWQAGVTKLLGLRPQNLAECFIDVDGEPLLERLGGLCRTSMESGLPILFQ
jgi:hypothetical protein